ncbi:MULTISPECIES: DUF1186 domain-containing protein [Methylobacterium]|uniref:DUF1186 domain-containing protein n=2 Tax=Pseudomonadota TaxID=1224 RepID=A0ABQ4SVS2_9HYPH|nr:MULTISPECIES: DUF1186 domain-containing protein [Methylobacterium]PIU04961.1 MAG: DUF1186 domain-containing protein [Methylobacterium sp. CG09_land_8_20_14_0_10_71_15]PIU11462.1 MAG: DUF1186 domain-containing protein [Methylobacterium sp. CG08_land_8_20_14_0_20_71_15]GBU18320.1 hypothetical protein AwMethylo_25350 [Methylobacterium sp.]GJE05963.1 hypothetical protein AOPFMNJM_1269 [Methylobacterium jeotgali]
MTVAALREARHLPEDALRRAQGQPDAILAPVLAAMEAAASGVELDEAEGNLVFWGLHALAGARETRAFAPLLALLRQDGDSLDALFGDALTETLARVLASLHDGSSEGLFRLALDSTLDDGVRNEVLGAAAFLAHQGLLPRDAFRDVLARFDDKRVAVEELGWVGWEEAIALLGLADLAPRVEAARRDRRLTGEFSDAEWFKTTLRRARMRPDSLRDFEERGLGTLDDPVAALAWTAEGAGEPVRNPWKDVGRNDPCPCGSGLKFKKCCLGKAA